MINVLLLYMTSPSEMNHKTCRSSISCKSYAINLNDDEETTALKLQLKMQMKLMKEYQEWIQTILGIINDKETTRNHIDEGTPIQKRLQVLEQLKKENFIIKDKIYEQQLKNEKLQQKIKEIKVTNNILISDYTISSSQVINEEKNQLERNVQLLANELDSLNESNQYLHNMIDNEKDSIMIKDANDSKDKLINEYMKLKLIRNISIKLHKVRDAIVSY